jgi:hypothetical protein
VAIANVDTDNDADVLIGISGAAKALYVNAPVPETRIAFSDVSVTGLGGDALSLKDVQGALILASGADGGVAGNFSGTVDGNFPGFTANLSLGVRFNSTKLAWDETISVGGIDIPVKFGANETFGHPTAGKPFVEISGKGVITLGPFTIAGSFTLGAADGATFTDLTIFLGQGPAFLDDLDPAHPDDPPRINPTAQGVYITGTSLKVWKSADGTKMAITAKGSIHLAGISGITLDGDALVHYNEDSSAHFTDPGDDVYGGPVAASEISFHGRVTLAFSGVELTGPIAFEKSATAGAFKFTLGNGAADPLVLNLGEEVDGKFPVSAKIASATIDVSPAGIVADINAKLDVSLGDAFSLTNADIVVDVNTTNNPVTTPATIPARSIRVVLGAVTPMTVTILGQSFTGSFAFEQVQGPVAPSAAPGTVAPKIVRVAATGVGFSLGGGIVTLSGGSALFVQNGAGLAGTVSGNIQVNIPAGDSPIVFKGTFGLSFNSTPKPVSERFTIAGQTLTLDLPGGPYLRVEGEGVELQMAGQRLGGDFVFENATLGQSTITRVAARNLTGSFGDGTTAYVTLSDGSGFFIVKPEGLAGQISGHVTVNVPDVTIEGTFSLQINNTPNTVDDTLEFGDQPGSTDVAVIGDVNGDVLPDLIVGTDGTATAALLYLNDGSGDPFDSLPPVALGDDHHAATALALGDLDGNGTIDLVVGMAGGDTRVFLNDGAGNFTPATASLASDASAIAIGDVDGTKGPDLVVGKAGGGLTLYKNKGADATTGKWSGFDTATTPFGSDTDTSPTAVLVADIDKDNKLDVVVLAATNRLYLGDGSGAFTTDDADLGTNGTALTAADLNGDGFLDLAIGSASAATNVYKATKDATSGAWTGFATGVAVSGDSGNTTSLALADLNGDGKLDLFAGKGGSALANKAFLGDGQGGFTAAPASLLGALAQDTQAVAAGDLNGDGIADLFVGNKSASNRLLLGTSSHAYGNGSAIGAVEIHLDQKGPFLQIAGKDIVIAVAGVSLTGSFEFRQATGAAGARIVTVSADAMLKIGDLADIHVTGTLQLTPQGLAAKLDVGGTITVGDFSFAATSVKVLVNTGIAAAVWAIRSRRESRAARSCASTRRAST